MDAPVRGKQSMGWDMLDKETSVVGAEMPRKREGLGTKCTEDTASYSHQQPVLKCGPHGDTMFILYALFHLNQLP